MVMYITPLSRQRISMQFYDTDYVHTPTRGVKAIDEQDRINTPAVNTTKQGMLMNTNAYSMSWVEGMRQYNRTPRGNKQCTMGQVQRAETIINRNRFKQV